MGNILIIGAGGQIGTELTEALRKKHGGQNVLATDIRESETLSASGPFHILNAMDKDGLYDVIRKWGITEIYHLAAVLSATGEKNPAFAWQLNMDSLLFALDACKELGVKRMFWPSSIAAFGPTTPRQNTPQDTVMDPNTVYGISKLAGELWCRYYFEKFGVDVRSIRYPGLISYKSPPGGGTTDYAIDIFHKAITDGKYTCFLSETARLPMMYMEDAIRATIELMEAPAEKVKVRTSYNVAGCSFSPEEIAGEIKKHLPAFTCTYEPDFREKIARSWPESMEDNRAREDWGWVPKYTLGEMVKDMLLHIGEQYKNKVS